MARRARCLRVVVLSITRRTSAGLRISGRVCRDFGPGIVKVRAGRPSVVWSRNRNAWTAMLQVLQVRRSSRSMWTPYAWTWAGES
jgi:hypothetical protein